METNPFIASQLYSNAQGIARPAAAADTGAATGSQGGHAFAAIADDFMATLRAGESTAMQGMAGRADPQTVVEALAASELAIETAVAVRDRVIEAYQEILRMPV